MNATSSTIRLGGVAVATRIASITRAILALLGLAAVLVVAFPAPRDLLMQHVAANAQSAAPAAQGAVRTAPIYSEPEESEFLIDEQRAVAGFIAKRYRIADQAVSAFVSTAYRAGQDLRVDPLLILAVVAVESRYNPVAESFMGAKGLMQIIPKYHLDKLRHHGGEGALLDPEVNILVGAQILREYLKRFGQLETALQVYGGAFDEPTSQYANKVLTERSRLEQTVQRLRQQG